MTYRYHLRDLRELTLRADCWAMLFEDGQARACRVIDPVVDAGGRVLVSVDGVERLVPTVDLVAPPRPLPFGTPAAIVEAWPAA